MWASKPRDAELPASSLRFPPMSSDTLWRTVLRAQSPTTELAYAPQPGVRVDWRNTEDRGDRVLMVVSRRGLLDASVIGPHLRRGSNAILVSGESARVRVISSGDQADMLCVSVDMASLGIAATELRRSTAEAPGIRWSRLAPLFSFLRSVCVTSAGGVIPRTLSEATATTTIALGRILTEVADDVATRALAYIVEYSSNPHLSVGTIADRLGTSPRTVQAALASIGTTVSDELRRARLARARRARQNHPGLGAMAVYQLAGFPSLAAMYRAIKWEDANSIRDERLSGDGESTQDSE